MRAMAPMKINPGCAMKPLRREPVCVSADAWCAVCAELAAVGRAMDGGCAIYPERRQPRRLKR